MSPSRTTPEARYAALCEAFAGDPRISTEGRGFGSDALKVSGRIFAMLVRDRLVVKLPRGRVDALVASGEGQRFDPGHGRLMKEWLSLDPTSDQGWEPLAREALAFVSAKR